MELCELVGCLPSELYKKHNPTPMDFDAVRGLRTIRAEEESRKLEALMGGGQT